MQFIYQLYEGTYLHLAIELKGNQLWVHRNLHAFIFDKFPPEQVVDTVNNPKWESLCSFLEQQQWEKEYIDPVIMDGSQWEMIYQSPTKKMKCYGCNEVPSNFSAFMKHIDALIKKGKNE
ncbi:MAG: hypothetical protein RLZZ500_2089 [Bacteroidota bacterium]|jgi:hypothetical protein